MENLTKYKNTFIESFIVKEEDLDNLKYQDISAWDSVGHMALMASLEETFEIELDIDDIIAFSSYKEGLKILRKYDVNFE